LFDADQLNKPFATRFLHSWLTRTARVRPFLLNVFIDFPLAIDLIESAFLFLRHTALSFFSLDGE